MQVDRGGGEGGSCQFVEVCTYSHCAGWKHARRAER